MNVGPTRHDGRKGDHVGLADGAPEYVVRDERGTRFLRDPGNCELVIAGSSPTRPTSSEFLTYP